MSNKLYVCVSFPFRDGGWGALIGSLVAWFVKLYFLILFAFIAGRIYSRINL